MLSLVGFYVLGIAMILLSVYLRFWRSKRRFNRRNGAGLQGFKSYEQSLKVGYLESIVRLLYNVLIIVGILILLAAIFDGQTIRQIDHW